MSPRVLSVKALEMLDDMTPFMRDEPMVQAVVNATAREFERIDAAAQAIRAAMFPATAGDVPILGGVWYARMLSMWEAYLGLPVAPAGVALADRQAKVTAHIQKRNSGAGSDWVAILTEALGGVAWTHQEGPGDYQVTLHFPYAAGTYTAAQVAALAREITPSHLDVLVGYSDGFLIGVSQIGIEPL